MEKTSNDLNSALALFQSLYKTQKGDIYTIVERFILVGVKSKGLISFSVEDISQLLKDSFNLEIPYSVIQKCIISHQEVFNYSRNKYVVVNPMDEEIDHIISEMNEIESYWTIVIDELMSFIEEKKEISDEEKNELGKYFFDFIIDREHTKDDDTRLYITQYIIEKEKDERFSHFINSIKEGMVIYKGIRYSSSPNDASWECPTDFFLDVEYLFSAYGMNGPFYEKCFFEFYNLINEINRASNQNSGRKRIRLFYFPETKKNVDKYFAQAIRIRRMIERYSNPQVAMDNILKACKEDVDVERYKINFYRKLKELDVIEYPDEIDLNSNKNFLFENDEFENKKNDTFDKEQIEEVNEYLQIADYINILRKGKSGNPLEKCRYMFLSDGKLSNNVSRFIKNYYENHPKVITRMGTFTELMWFKLKKGVINTNSSATINVVNKAKIIVSGLLQDNLKKQYDAVSSMEDDDITKTALYADLRTKRYSPDDINSESIELDITFIDETDYVLKYKQTQEQLRSQAAKADDLEKKLKQEKTDKGKLIDRLNFLEEYIMSEEEKKKKSAISSARHRVSPYRFFFKYCEILIHLLISAAFIIPSILFMKPEWVNIATVGSFYIAVEVLLVSFLKKRRNIIRLLFFKKYRRVLREEKKKME